MGLASFRVVKVPCAARHSLPFTDTTMARASGLMVARGLKVPRGEGVVSTLLWGVGWKKGLGTWRK